MAAYLIATIHEITDTERFGEYRRHVGATITEYGERLCPETSVNRSPL